MSLGYHGETWDNGDSPRPGERPEDRGGYDTFWTHGHRPVRTEAEEAAADRLAVWLAVRHALRSAQSVAMWAQQEREKKR